MTGVLTCALPISAWPPVNEDQPTTIQMTLGGWEYEITLRPGTEPPEDGTVVGVQTNTHTNIDRNGRIILEPPIPAG